ncbi:6407_t:CDS:2, partial [Cetraspora pellucida]
GNRDNESFSQVDENGKLNSDYDVTKGIGNNINPKRIQRNEDNQINKISKITEKDQNLSLTDNISGDDGSDYDSPGWSECEECYGPKNEFCDLCGCSVCKWKGDRGHILLCDGFCGKGFHTRCLKPPLARIPAGNWYCMRCSRKSKRKAQSDDSNSIKNVEVTEPTDDEVVNNRQSRNAENECIPSTSTNNENIHQATGNPPEVFKDKRSNNNSQQYNESYEECDTNIP